MPSLKTVVNPFKTIKKKPGVIPSFSKNGRDTRINKYGSHTRMKSPSLNDTQEAKKINPVYVRNTENSLDHPQ